jgi:signal transduction histidine kinase/ActR/RegA family two-component response regulator
MPTNGAADVEMESIESVVWAITDGVIVTDPEGRLLTANLAARNLLGGEEPLADLHRVLLHEPGGDRLPAAESPLRRALLGRRVNGMVVEIRRPQSSERQLVSWSASPVFQQSKLVLTVHTLRELDGQEPIESASRPLREHTGPLDASVRMRLEQRLRRQAEQLAEADRRKDEFLAMLGHELRNPLAPIHNAVQVLRRHCSAADPHLKWGLDVIERQVGQITRLVDDLVDVARITRGRIQLQRRPTTLHEIVFAAVEAVRPLMQERRHALVISVPPLATRVDVDPVRMTQVVANYLENAAKYTPPGGDIRVTLRQADGRAELRVRDSGIGIAPHVLPHVFEPFTQGDRPLDRSQGGLGLGLKLVRSLVELHGGAVEARSEGVGKGSEFALFLPLLPERPARATPVADTPVQPEPAPHARPPRRLLVVDDNEDVGRSFAVLLGAMGHDVRVEADGPSALAAVNEIHPDVVFLDIGLPGMSGYEVAEAIRRDHGRHSIVLVAVTGYGQDNDRERSFRSGFDHHLLKPVDVTVLETLLASLGTRRS